MYHSTYCGWYIDCSLTLHCDTVPLKLPLIYIGPQLYMMSPLLIHFVLSIVQCSAVLCAFVMWEWVMWRVYWLCWMETGHDLCGLYEKLLCHFSLQREDIVNNSSHCHNGSRLCYGYTSWWIHCTMNCSGQCCNHSTTVTLTSLISMFSKWIVHCVHLHFNSDSTWLHSHSGIEETEVDNWMQKNLYILQIYI